MTWSMSKGPSEQRDRALRDVETEGVGVAASMRTERAGARSHGDAAAERLARPDPLALDEPRGIAHTGW